jgi:hypothetical protein
VMGCAWSAPVSFDFVRSDFTGKGFLVVRRNVRAVIRSSIGMRSAQQPGKSR